MDDQNVGADTDRKPADAQPYSGVENLEVMREARNYTRFLEQLIAEAGGVAMRASVLDFGAGTGTFADLIAGKAAQLTCIEVDPSLRNHLREKGYETVGRPSEITTDSVDYVYTLNVLEHIKDDEAAIAEIYRMLRPGGRLLIYVPAFKALYTSMDLAVGHQRRYRRNELVGKTRAAGFIVSKARYVDSFGFFAALLYRVLGVPGGAINKSALIAYDRLIFPLSHLADYFLGTFFGKNVFVIAKKPPT